MRWLLSAALGRRRDLAADGVELLRKHRAAVQATVHVPPDGRFLVVMNHYERPGLRVWWPALLVTRAISEAQPTADPVRWLVTNRFYRFRLWGMRLPNRVVGWFLGRVAARYDLILVARPGAAAAARAVALREARRALDGADPRPVGSTPEGERGEGPVLVRPMPTSGKALAWLSRSVVPILPAGVYEDADGTLTARFGPTFVLPWPGLHEARHREREFADRVMQAIAAQLPPALRGPYLDVDPISSRERGP